MANAILPTLHPAQMLQYDSEMSVTLELENPHLMPTHRLLELIHGCAADVEPAVYGYLYGIWEGRQFAHAMGCTA